MERIKLKVKLYFTIMLFILLNCNNSYAESDEDFPSFACNKEVFFSVTYLLEQLSKKHSYLNI